MSQMWAKITRSSESDTQRSYNDQRRYNHHGHGATHSDSENNSHKIAELSKKCQRHESGKLLSELQEVLDTQAKLIQCLQNENVQLKNENHQLKQQIRHSSQPPDASNYSSATSPTGYHPSIAHLTCYKAVGSGNFSGADDTILQHVHDKLHHHNAELTINPWSPGCQSAILFCLRQSRVGSDVEEALRRVKGVKNISLVVLEHRAPHVQPSVPTNKVLSTNSMSGVDLIVDMAFWTPQGLYNCDQNDRAIDMLADHILSKTR